MTNKKHIDTFNEDFTGRLISLDAFRGMTIVAMILVNNPGSWEDVYPQLLHSEWIGCTFTDLIFPFFLFISGVAMWFSFKKLGSKDSWTILKKILKRATLIFIIGLFISWFPFYNKTINNLHFVGVLQRIAVSYLVASLVCIFFKRIWIAILASLILLGYWWIVTTSGLFEPFDKETVFSHGVDFIAFFSSPTSSVPIMIGFLVGSFIDQSKFTSIHLLKLTSIGIILILVGILWSFKFPIIKSLLWSSSYVLYTTGIGIVVFALCLLLIERLGFRSWVFPFVLFGVNPLFLYVLSIILDKLTWIIKIDNGESLISLHEWIQFNLFEPLAGGINGSLLYAIIFVTIHCLIAYWLFKKKIYIKV